MKERTAEEWIEAYSPTATSAATSCRRRRRRCTIRRLDAGGIVEVDDPRVGHRSCRSDRWSRSPARPAHVRGPAPLPGQHTDEVRPTELATALSPQPRVAPNWPAGRWTGSRSSRRPTTTPPPSPRRCWPIWAPG